MFVQPVRFASYFSDPLSVVKSIFSLYFFFFYGFIAKFRGGLNQSICLFTKYLYFFNLQLKFFKIFPISQIFGFGQTFLYGYLFLFFCLFFFFAAWDGKMSSNLAG